MRKRANLSVYWPGMTTAISNFRDNCLRCDENAPSQPAEPIVMSPAPEWPFQQIAADYFELEAHAYLIAVVRYSGYPCISHFKPGQTTSKLLIKECRQLFSSYGVPEEWGSDGGPQFISHEFKTFLDSWGIHHRLSSVEYPQSNGRAEVGVKTAKRILMDNLNKDGSLNNDKVTAALLQYKNTPLSDIGLSPAQILFHRELRDTIPTHRSNYHLHKDWLIAAQDREALFAKRNQVIETRYNKHTRKLDDLPTGTYVLIQTGKNKWKKHGLIVEKLKHRQYKVKVLGSGRVTLRNRRFLKPCKAITPSLGRNNIPITPRHTTSRTITVDSEIGTSLPHPRTDTHRNVPFSSPLFDPLTAPASVPCVPSIPLQEQQEEEESSHTPSESLHTPSTTSIGTRASSRLQNIPPQQHETDPGKLPLKLRNLLSHNNPGLLE